VPGLGQASAVDRDNADIWKSAHKVVHSATLESVATPSTRLKRTLDSRAVRSLVSDLDRYVPI
jgi:hypothetical protein